jgi:hypothetical protein
MPPGSSDGDPRRHTAFAGMPFDSRAVALPGHQDRALPIIDSALLVSAEAQQRLTPVFGFPPGFAHRPDLAITNHTCGFTMDSHQEPFATIAVDTAFHNASGRAANTPRNLEQCRIVAAVFVAFVGHGSG